MSFTAVTEVTKGTIAQRAEAERFPVGTAVNVNDGADGIDYGYTVETLGWVPGQGYQAILRSRHGSRIARLSRLILA